MPSQAIVTIAGTWCRKPDEREDPGAIMLSNGEIMKLCQDFCKQQRQQHIAAQSHSLYGL
jgi:hypothetical protein